MKRAISIVLTCALLMSLLFVTGCGDLFGDLFGGSGGNGGNGDGNGDNGGENGDNGDGEGGSSDGGAVVPSGFRFELSADGSSYFLAEYFGTATDVVIPSTYSGKPVTAIGDGAFFGLYEITSVTIPDGVTSIGEEAFDSCYGLTGITIPASVTSIGEDAFYCCYKLVEVCDLSSLGIEVGSEDNGRIGYYARNIYTATSGESKLSTDDDGYIFYADDDGCYLIGYLGSDTALTLPESCDGRAYDIYKYTFAYFRKLRSVVIPEGVTEIGKRAFHYCDSLESITVPEGVTSIGDGAFYECEQLTCFGVPGTVTKIGDGAFEYCYKLVEVYDRSSLNITKGAKSNGKIGYYALNVYTDTDGESKLSTDDDGYMFYEDGDLCYLVAYTAEASALTLPSSCSGKDYKIYTYAFYNRSDITSVVISSGVTEIGRSAFEGCCCLTSVTVSECVTKIDDNAFANCFGLAEVYDLSSLGITAGSVDNGRIGVFALAVYDNADAESKLSTDVDGYVFFDGDDGCYLIGYTGASTELALPDGFGGKDYSINKYAFARRTDITGITIPDKVTGIGEYAFALCYGLKGVSIPDSVTDMGDCAFYKCLRLTSAVIGNGVTRLGDNVFGECSRLESLTIGDGVTEIDGDAFCECGSIEALTVSQGNSKYHSIENCIIETASRTLVLGCNSSVIPDDGSVTAIGERAFYGCSRLKSVTVPDCVVSIGAGAFGGCSSLESITLPFVGGSASADTPSEATLFGYIFGTSYVRYFLKIKQTYSRSSNSEIYYYFPVTLKSVTVTGGNILYGAFYGCKTLTSITLPEGVTDIGDLAFWYCEALTSMDIPDSVTRIGASAFAYCTALASIDIPDGVTSIGDHAFIGCYSITDVTMGDSVKNIGKEAFGGCSGITAIEIPKSVTNIGEMAFSGCTALTTINYAGSEEEWKEIKKGTKWIDKLADITVNYNCKGN